MVLVDAAIRSCGFFDFVSDIVRTINDERKKENEEFQDRVLWELWLHRVHNMDYQEFAQLSKNSESTETIHPETLGNIVMESAAIMESFCPD